MNATVEDFRRIGLTSRRVHYWSDRGWLISLDDHPGTGTVRQWPPHELLIAAYMWLLVQAGLTAPAAARAARARGQLSAAVAVRVTLVAEDWSVVADTYNALVADHDLSPAAAGVPA